MAKLILERDASVGDAAPVRARDLREWLNGAWCMLFSHPEHFAQCDLEADRWMLTVREAFAAAAIRPIGLAPRSKPGDSGCEWLALASGDEAVSLGFIRPARVIDLQRRALRAALSRAHSPFVMIIDGDLRLRRSFLYTALDRLPSLFDLIGVGVSARDDAGRRDGDKPASLFIPMRSAMHPLQRLARRS